MEKLIFEKSRKGRKGYTLPKLDVPAVETNQLIDPKFIRTEPAEFPEVSENELVRHFVRLSNLNYNIDKGFYPLGSCTMKYNPKVNEKTASLDGFTNIHPLIDDKYVQGALQLMYELGNDLMKITGMKGVTLQPSAGAAGELTGILMIRAYHLDRQDFKRTKILIPDSAHGTNPASAAIGGFQIINVKSDSHGRVDLEDLKSKINDEVAGMMLTNPNTLGIFETNIVEIQELLHNAGALLYMDGANLNALLGIVHSGKIGVDALHINLHKTFSTPHGGGGPGSGAVVVSERLIPYLPVPQINLVDNQYKFNFDIPKSIGKVHSFFGNFLVFVRAYTYIKMLGKEGLKETSKGAIINANYLKALIKDYFDFPYPAQSMHEFVMSGDRQKKKGATTMEIAKRLLDYGFHAPTVYFPLIVHEAMLVEPTETETKESIEAFANALIAIDKEIDENPELVKTAPHNTPIKRVNDAYAARNLNVKWVD
jgi:glycine dehydrogenase subunit 2